LFADELMKSVACRLGACVGAILFERIRLNLNVAGSFVCQALDCILALRHFDSRDPLVVRLRKLAGQHELNVVVWDKTDAETGRTSAARVRVSLDPRQIVHIDSTDNKSINLQCGDDAYTLTWSTPVS
jgi:hypothetical protein